MEKRTFGRTGMRLSVLGFGCGAVGGSMVRGDPLDQERTIARALAAGVNYFDTAVQYGNGESEKNLGRVLQTLKPADAFVGTKVRLPDPDFGRIAEAVTQSLEGSLARLRREHVDIFTCTIRHRTRREALERRQVLDEVVPAFERLRRRARRASSGSPRSATPRRSSGDLVARLRQRAGGLQYAQSVRGCGAACELSGAGLRTSVRSHRRGRHRRHRHPRARRWGAVGIGRAASRLRARRRRRSARR